MLTTRQKLSLAKFASLGLRGIRQAAGLGDRAQVVRKGIRWDLDLREGIDLAIYLGQYQTVPRPVEQFLEENPQSTVLDVGANIGAFALPLARAVGEGGHVIACEATDYAFEKLKHNLSLNWQLEPRTTPIQVVLGQGGTADGAQTSIYSSWRVDGSADAEEHPLHGGRPMSTNGAIHASLDELYQSELRALLSRLKLIKLDVDGHELSILRGARQLVSETRPQLLIEIAPHVQDEREGGLEALTAEIEVQGFQLHDPVCGQAVSHDAATLRQRIPNGAGADFLGLLGRHH